MNNGESDMEDILDIGLGDEYWPELDNMEVETPKDKPKSNPVKDSAKTGMSQSVRNNQPSSSTQSYVKPIPPVPTAAKTSNSFIASNF